MILHILNSFNFIIVHNKSFYLNFIITVIYPSGHLLDLQYVKSSHCHHSDLNITNISSSAFAPRVGRCLLCKRSLCLMSCLNSSSSSREQHRHPVSPSNAPLFFIVPSAQAFWELTEALAAAGSSIHIHHAQTLHFGKIGRPDHGRPEVSPAAPAAVGRDVRAVGLPLQPLPGFGCDPQDHRLLQR